MTTDGLKAKKSSLVEKAYNRLLNNFLELGHQRGSKKHHHFKNLLKRRWKAPRNLRNGTDSNKFQLVRVLSSKSSISKHIRFGSNVCKSAEAESCLFIARVSAIRTPQNITFLAVCSADDRLLQSQTHILIAFELKSGKLFFFIAG